MAVTASRNRKLRIAVVGVGRMGSIHAENLHSYVPRAEVVALCDIRPDLADWAAKNIGDGVKTYSDAATCFKESGAEAVLIAAETAKHAPLAELAIQHGLHVLLEKPIAVDVETSKRVVEAAHAHPELKTMVALVRRFDTTNIALKKKILAGDLGNIHHVKSGSNDVYDPSGFFVRFSGASGGIFTDVGVHDIDLARWMVDAANGAPNPKKQVNRVWAVGQCARHPELAELGDADNGFGTVEFANGAIHTMHLGRTASNGHECYVSVYGTEQQVTVNGRAQKNRMEIRDAYGVRNDTHETHFDVFHDAFVAELQAFTASVLDDTKVPVSMDDALEASKIAYALTLSFRNGVPVYFDENGDVIPPSVTSK